MVMQVEELAGMTEKKSVEIWAEGQVIRYWHPRKVGWHHAILIRSGRKWATVQDYWPRINPKRHRVPVDDVREALL